MHPAGTSFVTIEPAAITHPSPIVTPGNTTQPAPTQTFVPMVTPFSLQGCSW